MGVPIAFFTAVLVVGMAAAAAAAASSSRLVFLDLVVPEYNNNSPWPLHAHTFVPCCGIVHVSILASAHVKK